MISELETLGALDLASDTMENQPRVLFNLKPATMIHYFTCLRAGEINGLGLVEKQGNDFLIPEVFILDQETNENEANIVGLSFARYVDRCEDPSKILLQWHSHDDGAVFWSSHKDIPTIKRWLGDFLISMVVNKHGDCLCRLDLFRPFRLSLRVPVFVVVPLEVDQEILSFCKREIASKVKILPEAVKIRKLLKPAKVVLKKVPKVRKPRLFSDWIPEKRMALVPWKIMWQEVKLA